MKELEDKVGVGEELTSEVAMKVHRGIARVNYMAHDRPDLSAEAKVMSQRMAKPREGVVPILKRCVRYMKKYPSAAILVPRGVSQDQGELVTWTDSDWAGDVGSRRSTSGGFVTCRGAVLSHWSKMQSNVALSSAEAELNATVKGLGEMVGYYNLIEEIFLDSPTVSICVDASACKGMLLRHGTGKVKHLSVKQLWSQEVVNHFGVQVCKVARNENPADMLTHSVVGSTADVHLEGFNMKRFSIPNDEFCE